MDHWEIEARRPTTGSPAEDPPSIRGAAGRGGVLADWPDTPPGFDRRPRDEIGPSAGSGCGTIAAIGIGVPCVSAAIVFVLGMAASPHVPDGQCEGIGFGCTLAPRDGVWVLGTWLGFFVVPVLYLLAALVTWAVRRRPSW